MEFLPKVSPIGIEEDSNKQLVIEFTQKDLLSNRISTRPECFWRIAFDLVKPIQVGVKAHIGGHRVLLRFSQNSAK
jgi:hypothetical protein